MSLTLLSPWFLLAGLGIAVPVLIHLMQRRREVVLPFAMVRFILLARKRSSRRLKLRRLFLLFLRVTAVAILAVIIARPVLLTADASLTSGRTGRTVLIIDNSLSMTALPAAGIDRFSLLGQVLGEYAGQSAPGALFAVLAAAGESDEETVWVKAGEALERAGGISIRADRGDFNRVFTEAHRLLKETGGDERRIAVFTDLAWGSWSDFGYGNLVDGDLGIPVEIFRLGPSSRNAGVTGISVAGEHRVSGGNLSVRAVILNEGGGEEIAAELFVDDRVADRQVVTVTPGGEAEVMFSPGDLPPGSSVISVRLGEDEYRADDSRSAGLSLSPPLRVLLVDGDPGRSLIESETFFLGEALNPAVPFGDEPIVTVIASREEAVRMGLDEFDLVVLANVSPRGELDLPAFLSRGGGVVVFWGDRCRAEDYQRHLPSLLPGRVTGVEDAMSGSPFRLGEVERGFEVFSPFREPGTGTFTTASFLRRLEISVSPGFAVAARYSDGKPWIATGRVGAGTVAFVTSSADIEWNDLPTKPVFVPFVRRLALSLADRLGGTVGEEITAGEEMIVRGGPGEAFKEITFTDPEGATFRDEFLPDGAGTKGSYGETGEVGIYRYSWDGGGGVFAVNPPAEESFGRSLSDKEIESRFQKVQLEIADVDGRDVVAGYSQKGAVSLTRPLFMALVCLLILEMIVAGPRSNPLAMLRTRS